MNNANTTPLYTLDRSKLREASEFLRSMWDTWPSNYYVIPDGATIEPEPPTDVASDKGPMCVTATQPDATG